MNDKLDRANEFYHGVGRKVSGGAGYLDAIIQWCAERELEVESVGTLIDKNPQLKAKLRREAEELHFIKKRVRLPV